MVPLLKRMVWLKILYIQKSDELFLETVVFVKKTQTLSSWQNYQFLTINQLKIQITENFKSLSLEFYGATCQKVSTKAFEASSQECPL